MMDEQTAEALRLMREIVAGKGADYVYPKAEKSPPTDVLGDGDCLYLTYDENGQPTGPSCIVGHYLTRKGVPLGEIAHREGSSATHVLQALNLADPDDGPLARAFDAAQGEQDEGQTWGEALRAFERKLGL